MSFFVVLLSQKKVSEASLINCRIVDKYKYLLIKMGNIFLSVHLYIRNRERLVLFMFCALVVRPTVGLINYFFRRIGEYFVR